VGKKYVDVILRVTGEGAIKPLFFKVKEAKKWIKIEKISDSPERRASFIGGGVGVKYDCIVVFNNIKRVIYLFDESDEEHNHKWFIEDTA
jgi:hypothetical protein